MREKPNIDAFAKRSVRFTRAYPELLPTIPPWPAYRPQGDPFRNYKRAFRSAQPSEKIAISASRPTLLLESSGCNPNRV